MVEDEKCFQAQLDGYDEGYDTCKKYILRNINKMHDKEFYALCHLIEKEDQEDNEDLLIAIAKKTWVVATLEKVRDALEAM